MDQSGVRDASVVAKAKAIAGTIRGQGDRNEATGRLTEETVAALRSGDFYGLLVPRCYGGMEAGVVDALAVIETISEADGSTGWALMACNVGTGSAAAYLPRAGAEAVFGNRRQIPIISGGARRRAAPCRTARASASPDAGAMAAA